MAPESSTQTLSLRAGILIGILLLGSALPAAAQRLVACTNTLSAARESARAYLQALEFGPVPRVVSRAEPLPGIHPVMPLLQTPAGAAIIAHSNGVWNPMGLRAEAQPAWLSAYAPAPWGVGALGKITAAPGCHTVQVCMAASPGESVVYLIVAEVINPSNGGPPEGQAEIFIHDAAASPVLKAAGPPIPLPGLPIAAASRMQSPMVAIACQGPSGGGALVVLFDPVTGAASPITITLADPANPFSPTPVDIEASQDGAHFLVLTSGYAMDRASGEPASWLYLISSQPPYASETVPLSILGAARSQDAPITPGPDATFWVGTRTPGADFAYAIRLRVTPEGLNKIADIPLTSVSAPLRIASSPDGTRTAVAMDNRLEIWQESERRGVASVSFEAPIAVLRWTPVGLFAGEGGRVHQLNPKSGASEARLQLQTGWVLDLAWIPEALITAETLQAENDDDADDIPNAADPEPAIPSPQITIPDHIAFREEAAGRELRALYLDSPLGAASAWRILQPDPPIPWLVLHPLSGEGFPGLVYMGVDPVRYTAMPNTSGALTLHVTGTTPNAQAYGSPATIETTVLPIRDAIPRILWIWGTSPTLTDIRTSPDTTALKPLADVLSAPPLSFGHRTANAPILDALTPYSVIVIQLSALMRGMVTRQALFDEYLPRGGGVLLVASSPQEAQNTLITRWLDPVGLRLMPELSLRGVFTAESAEGLAYYWRGIPLEHGCPFQANGAWRRVQGLAEPQAAVFAARDYGYGRIAVLASPEPLEANSIATATGRRLALELFRWLASARRDAQDLDGDGLTDDTEDANQNREIDAGETHFLIADSDGDGLPDGLEDRNGNGMTDEGETDPRNPDSDMDGIYDGADAYPLPELGAPYITAIAPSQGPAEGGKFVNLTGRNFSPESQVWFGGRLARNVDYFDTELLRVETPHCSNPAGQTVDVRVKNPSQQRESLLVGGYHYTSRSQVGLIAEAEDIEATPSGFKGQLAIRLQAPATSVQRLLAMLDVEPRTGFQWGELGELPENELTVRWKILPSGNGWLDISGPISGGILLRVPWTLNTQTNPPAPWRIVFRKAIAAAPSGVPLDLTTKDARIATPSHPGEERSRAVRPTSASPGS